MKQKNFLDTTAAFASAVQPSDRYRLAQAQKLLDLFEEANGHPARTAEELAAWLGSPRGRPVSATPDMFRKANFPA